MNIIAMKTNSTFGIYDPFGRRESERKDNRKEKKHNLYNIFSTWLERKWKEKLTSKDKN